MSTYAKKRGQLEEYFDRTAAQTWARLTSDAPVSGVRAKVRAGRDAMRNTLLSWLPEDMTGLTLLDAGCGTGALALEAAKRGAHVTAIDISPTLVNLAAERSAGHPRLDFRVGDMLDPALGRFDHIVAMDSLIHYRADDVAHALAGLAARADRSVAFTFAPATPLLNTMWAVGKLFPKKDRSPAIEPTAHARLKRLLARDRGLSLGRDERISRAFYISHAQEIRTA